MRYLYVALGGAIGGFLRYSTQFFDLQYPLHTQLVNIIGSFLLGYISFRSSLSNTFKLCVGTGALGAFTTFSTFSKESVQLFMNGQLFVAAFYMFSTVLLAIGAAWIGMRVATRGDKR